MYGEKQIIIPGGQNTAPSPTPIQKSRHFSAKKKEHVKTGLFDIAAFFAVFGSLFLIINSFFNAYTYTDGIVITAAYLFLLIFSTVYIVTKTKKFPLKAVFPAILCLAVAVSFSINYNNCLSISVSFLMFLSGIYCMSLMNICPFSGYWDLIKGMFSIFLLPVGTIYMPILGLFQHRKPKKIGRYIGVAVGIVLAIPVFILVAYLLTEGDAAFGNVLGGLFKHIEKLTDRFFDSDSLFWLFPALICTPYVASTMFSFRHGVVKDFYKESQKVHISEKLYFIPDSFIAGFYSVVSLCYVVYLLSQLTYIFGAFSGNIPIGVSVTLSQYARRGFFEMSAVALINLCLIAVGIVFAKRKNGQISKIFKGFSVFFCLFTIMLIITAMSKMGLYITELGLTYKRIQVTLIDLVLLVVFLCILIKLFAKHFPYMKIIMFTSLSVLTLYCTVGADRVIGSFNTWAYLSGYHDTVDIDTLKYLNSEYQALINLDKLTECKDTNISYEAKYSVYDLYDWWIDDSYDYSDSQHTGHVESILINAYIKENEERIKGYEPNYIGYSYDNGWYYNGDVCSEEPVSFTINTEKEIKSISFTSTYETVTLTDSEDTPLTNGKTHVFNWKYNVRPTATFASILVITKDGSMYPCTVCIGDTQEIDLGDSATCIFDFTMQFELRDNDYGGLMFVEV